MTPKTLLLAALLVAAPAFAQPAPPAPPAAHHAGPHHGAGSKMGRHMGMFPSMSEAGRAIMREAMMAGGNRRDDRQKVEAAREKMLAALEAERFDAGAVKRAMDEERSLADATRQQRQAAMLAAFGRQRAWAQSTWRQRPSTSWTMGARRSACSCTPATRAPA